jgi:thiamine-monophosphate kinase
MEGLKTLGELGELGLIERIRKKARVGQKDVVLGIGDDCAAFRVPPGKLCLLTTDALVQGVHFDLSFLSYKDLGWRSLAVNLSDVAAMAGKAVGALVTLCLPQSMKVGEADELYAGMFELAKKFKVDLVGGDTVRSPVLVLNLTVWGEVEPGKMATRSGAKPGDLLLVTGELGGAQAGLEVLSGAVQGITEPEPILKRHRRPMPRLREAQALSRAGGVQAMIDISDGLASEGQHLAKESRVGIEIWEEKIPILPVTQRVARAKELPGTDLALFGGDDYELLFTAPERRAGTLQEALRKLGTRTTVIGRVARGRPGVVMVTKSGERKKITRAGFDHFRG